MDFARKQLEKYGWSDGKGLGKNENGISEALKPKLKRSVTGVGHDAASDFTEHWWTELYNKAAGNVEVEEKNGKTKKIKTKDTEEFEITNSTWKIKKNKKKSKKEEKYADYFVRKAVLANGGSKMEKTENSSEEESDGEGEQKDVFKMTDEELFAACEGRTAHKGARHGLRATGKLARIAQQEQILLTQSQYEGYSHAKKRKAEEELSSEVKSDENEDVSTKKLKNKKKNKNVEAEVVMSLPADYEKSDSVSVASNNENNSTSRKSKKLKAKGGSDGVSNEESNAPEDSNTVPEKKKKKRKNENEVSEQIVNDVEESGNVEVVSKKVKKKKFKSAND